MFEEYYSFNNNYIKENYLSKKEYYYIGFQSIDFYITRILYKYLSKYNTALEFCCDFTLLQKFSKKICSKEYFSENIISNDKEVYSYIGAVICDCNTLNMVEDVIEKIYKIEEFLLRAYKKENNKYVSVYKYIKKSTTNITTNYSYINNIECSCYISSINMYFYNSGSSMLEAKYNTLVDIDTYLTNNKLNLDIIEFIGDYNVDNSYDKLEQLCNTYFTKPTYLYIEHTNYEDIKYEVRCSIDNISFYSVKIHNSKELARNLASFSMLEMLIEQYK